MKMKKAKSGSSLGMKSVKAGYDKNPGVTRADIIVAAKKKAKGGTKMKKALFGAKSGIFDGGILGMMKRKRQQKAASNMQPSAPNMQPTTPKIQPSTTTTTMSAMKKGGKMIKKSRGGSKIKKAQGGDNLNLVNQYSGSSSSASGSSPESMLRTRQYKRLGRLAAKNPSRAKKVAGRMTERATREARGKKYMSTNISKLMPATPTLKKGGKMKKMRGGGTISPSKSSTSTRLSTYGRTIGKNTAGKAKGGTKMKKCKYGC